MKSPGIELKKSTFDANHVDKLIGSGNFDAAQNILTKKLKKTPRDFNALLLKGKLLWQKGKRAEAHTFLSRAQINARGLLEKEQGALTLCNFHHAAKDYKASAKAAETFLRGEYGANNLTFRLVDAKLKSNEWDSVLPILNILERYKNDSYETLTLICLAYETMGKIDQAIEYAQQGKKYHPEATALLVKLYLTASNIPAADHELQHALATLPDNLDINQQYAWLLCHHGKAKEAIQYLKTSDVFSEAHTKWTLGTALFNNAQMEEGHQFWEYRYSDPLFASKTKLLPRIDFTKDKPPTLKKILISREEGVGDQIRYFKYISLINPEDRKNILVNCEDRLIPLMSQAFPDIHFVCAREMTKEYMQEQGVSHQTLLSSSFFLSKNEMSSPADMAYLNIQTLDKPILPQRESLLKVGICWRSIKQSSDRLHWYMPLKKFAGIFKDLDCELISLQNSVTDEEAALIREHSGKELITTDVDAKDDFLGLSKLINETDIVISTATATCELSGALGKKTWVIGNKHPNRWYLSQRYQDLFYPDIKMYLNEYPADWSSTAKQVKAELINLLQENVK